MTTDSIKTTKKGDGFRSRLQSQYSFVAESSHYQAIATVWSDNTLSVDILTKENQESVCGFVVNYDTTIVYELSDLISEIVYIIERKQNAHNTHRY